MIRARPRALIVVLIAALAAAALGVAAIRREPTSLPARPPAERPALLFLTSLPLLFGEDFSLEGGGSPVLRKLETRYRLVPISVTDPGELAKGRLLLMAQPPAQTAENLVALDQWVRGGGRVMLLADPMLERPSKLPLGHPLRPSPMFADTGLLTHWGLRLDTPDQRGPVKRSLGGHDVVAVSPGSFEGACKISKDRLVAKCPIGKGWTTVVADADILGMDDLSNLDGLIEELAELESK